MSGQQVKAPPAEIAVPPQLLEATARTLVAALAPPSQPVTSGGKEATDFLTARQFARRLGISRETVRRMTANERAGIWGSTTPNKRRALRRAAATALISRTNDGAEPGTRRSPPMRHRKQAVLRFRLADLAWVGAQ